MDRAKLQKFLEYSPNSAWRATLRSILFARTDAYLKDFRMHGEQNMISLAALGDGTTNEDSSEAYGLKRSNRRVSTIDVYYRDKSPDDGSLQRKYDLADFITTLLVVLNSVFLAMWDPLAPQEGILAELDTINNVFSFIFLIDLSLHIAALGFIVFRADPWYIFDAIFVVSGVLSSILELSFSFTPITTGVLRAFRVLVLLRSIRTFETLRIIVKTILGTIVHLKHLISLFILFLLVFGIAGVSQYSSRLRTRCVNEDYWNETQMQYVANTYYGGMLPYGNIKDFVRFQSYDLFLNQIAIRERNAVSYKYGCRDQLYNMNRSLFEQTACASTFTNAARGYDSSAPYPYMDLVALPPMGSAYYATYNIYRDPTSLLSWQSTVWREQTCDNSDALVLIGYRCPAGYRCERIQNPLNGNVGFDNLLEAMLTLFTAVTLEGWYHTMTWTMMGVDVTAAIFFVVVVTIGALFIANLAIIELTVQYEHRIKEEQRFDDERKIRIKYEETSWLWRIYDRVMMELEMEDEEESDEDIDDLPTLERWAINLRNFVKQPIFKFAVIGSIVSNTVILLMYSSKSGDTYKNLSELAHYCFVSFLAVEMIIRLVAADNILQFIVQEGLLNFVDILTFCFGLIDVFTHDSVNFRPAMALRLGRVVWELAQFSNTFRRWLMVVVRTVKASLVIALFLLTLIFLFGVIGLYIFGGTFCNMYDSTYEVVLPDNTSSICPMRPRANYDTIAMAMLSTLIITSGDGWQYIMYQGITARGSIFSAYFIGVLLICKYLIVNLLIGIFLHEAVSTEKIEDARVEEVFRKEEKIRGLIRSKQKSIQAFLSSFFATPEEALVDALDPRFSKFQLQLQAFVESKAFKASMIILSFISCFCLAIESPIRAPDTKEEALLFIADVVSNSIFALEMVVKVISYGLIMSPQSYIRRDQWNVFDFIVVGISFTSEGLLFAKKGDRTQPIFSALRVLRAVRPIRFASGSEGFRIIFKAVINSLKPLFFLFFMLFSLATLWSVMGVQWFAGTFSRCMDPNIKTAVECRAAGFDWVTPYNNFDNIAQSYMSLLAISTTENWADIMFNGMDAVGRGVGPSVNEGKRFAVFFASFVTIGGMYFISLLISVLIKSYQDAKKDFPHRNHFLNPQEQAWVYSHNDLLSKVPLVDYDTTATTGTEAVFIYIRTACRKVERSPLFDLLVYCMIIVGFIVAAVDHYPKSTAMSDFIVISGLIFAVAFCIEMFIKIVSEGLKGFFKSRWNRFDFLITTLNLIGMIMELAFSTSTFVTVFRLLRCIRLLRLVRKSRTLQGVLKRILLALFALKNTVAILFLIYFIFGVMGMRMFGRVSWGEHINQRQNFGDIVDAMLIMFRCSTGGEWLQLVEAVGQASPKCDSQLDGCVTPVVAQIYFIVFEVIAQYIFINLFTSVIFDIFTETDEVAQTVNDFEAGQFIKLWTCFDPEGTYRIESRYLVSFLRGIPRQCILSLGHIHETRRRQHEIQFLKNLPLEELNGKIELQDVIRSLLQKTYQEMMVERSQKLLAEANNGGDEEKEMTEVPNPSGANGHSEEAAQAKPSLSHDAERALKRNSDKVFRRKTRDLHRPLGEGVPVAKRYAINVIEQYFLQCRERQNEHKEIQAETLEMRKQMDQFQKEFERRTQRDMEMARDRGSHYVDEIDLEEEDDRRYRKSKAPGKHWQKVRNVVADNVDPASL